MSISPARLGLSRMTPREANEPHRVASSLELFFDLVFVIAVSSAASNLHHALTEGHHEHGVTSFAIMFFCIWWAWMNFTWFATSFDVDDWLYRVLTITQMGGVVVFSAGISTAFTEGDFTVCVIGYVIMRICMATQWFRAGISNPDYRITTFRYGFGILIAQALWVGWLLLFSHAPYATLLMVPLWILELSVPIFAETAKTSKTTPWHPHHITERYSLFTLVILGEGLLGSANAIIEGTSEVEALHRLIAVAVLALVGTAALWWIYFWPPHHGLIGSFRQSLTYGYVHYFVFAAAAAFAAGIELLVNVETGHGELGERGASLAIAIPVALFLLGIWFIVIRHIKDSVVNTAMLGGAVLVFADVLIPFPAVWTCAVLVGIVATLVVRRRSAEAMH